MNTITATTAQGERSCQEDHLLICEHPDGDLLGVFDGHGGENCSLYLSGHFVDAFSTHLEGNTAIAAMRKAFSQMAKETKDMHDGSTASVVWIPRNGDKAVFAVLGDSPILTDTKRGFHISPEHNARTNVKERDAAVNRGAVYRDGYLCSYRRGLQMARAFGDRSLTFLRRVPQIYQREVGNWILVATDGAFDPGHTQINAEALKVKEIIDGGGSAGHIVDRALAVPTKDNVTAILWRRN